MDVQSLSHQFVFVHAGEPRVRVAMGVVIGFMPSKPCGVAARVFNLSTKATWLVDCNNLELVPMKNIINPATVIGLWAEHHEFGRGEIRTARHTLHMMLVWLRGKNGESGFLRLDQVTVLGPKPE